MTIWQKLYLVFVVLLGLFGVFLIAFGAGKDNITVILGLTASTINLIILGITAYFLYRKDKDFPDPGGL